MSVLRCIGIEIVCPESGGAAFYAEALLKKLASYRVPGAVRKKTGIKDLAAVKDPWLIVICTPEPPKSPEVREKIAEYTERGRYGNILTLLAEGTPGESFPKELIFEERPDGSVIEHEPLAANITAGSRRESLSLLPVEMLRLLAPMLGVSFDELRNRRGRSRMIVASAVAGAVILGASVFLGYALDRMKTISAQNEALRQQYELAQAAALRADEQRDAAREEYAATTAIRAREVLDGGDSELAMLMCLEFLPEAGLTTELPAVFDDALEGLCAAGYVPVTSAKEYTKTRHVDREPGASDVSVPEEEPLFPETIKMPVPEGYDNGKETFDLSLEVYSEEFGYAVYRGSFEISRQYSSSVFRTRICFKDDPGRDYYMPFWTEAEAAKWLTAKAILPDGTFIGTMYSYPSGGLFRYDPFTGSFVDFYDEMTEDSPGTVGEEEGISSLILRSDISVIDFYPEVPGLIFARTRSNTSTDYNLKNEDVKTYVLSTAPLKYLTTLEDVIAVWLLPGTDYLLGSTGEQIKVYRAAPFEYLYTLADRHTYHLNASYYFEPFLFPDGREWMYGKSENGKVVYDLKTGKTVSEITVSGLEYDQVIASDGMIVTSVNSVPTLFRPEDGSVFASISGVDETDPTLYGAYDEASGRRGHELIRAGMTMYMWRNGAIPVPGDLEGRIALAKELLAGRQLTEKERRTYGLEQ